MNDNEHLKVYNKKEKPVMSFSFYAWRKMRDSNPRYPKGVYRISSPAHSVTLPIFQLRLQR